MSDRLREALLRQALGCAQLGSPFMKQWCTLLADRLAFGDPISDRILSWPGDVTAMGQSVPLRLAGALHALVLQGRSPYLTDAYPPHEFNKEAVWTAIQRAFRKHTAHLQTWLDSPPQTNEVRRAAGLIAGACWLRDVYDLPLVVSELGASAGLNLHFDRYCLDLEDRALGAKDSAVRFSPAWTGPRPPDLPIEIRSRAGVDLRPIDASEPDQKLRLLAYLWPDQPERMKLTRAAIDLSHTRPVAGNASQWLQGRLAETYLGCIHLVTHTIAWQYFPVSTQNECLAALQEAGANATSESPIARLSMEADGQQETASLSLQVWDGDQHRGEIRELARIDFHGRALAVA